MTNNEPQDMVRTVEQVYSDMMEKYVFNLQDNLSKELEEARKKIGAVLEAIVSQDSCPEGRTEKPWKPKRGDRIWFFDVVRGKVTNEQWMPNLTDCETMLEHGYIFRTEQEAIEAQKRDMYRRQFENMGSKFIPGRDNWHMAVEDCGDIKVLPTASVYYREQGAVYFGTKEQAMSAVATIGEGNFKKYVMGIEEGDVQ